RTSLWQRAGRPSIRKEYDASYARYRTASFLFVLGSCWRWRHERDHEQADEGCHCTRLFHLSTLLHARRNIWASRWSALRDARATRAVLSSSPSFLVVIRPGGG